MSETTTSWLDGVAGKLRDAGVFAEVTIGDEGLLCRAREIEDEAFYFVDPHAPGPAGSGAGGAGGAGVWAGLFTANRWLSESIEADLLHTGDKMEDLLEEELVDLGLDQKLPIEHFRDDAKRFVFRSWVTAEGQEGLASDETATKLATVVRAYEACFYELGDMSPEED
ncbi:MAG: hypothetical protein AAGI68_01895 [Planctomycetota bacterium]